MKKKTYADSIIDFLGENPPTSYNEMIDRFKKAELKAINDEKVNIALMLKSCILVARLARQYTLLEK